MHEIKRDKSLTNKLIHNYSDMMFAGVVAGNNSGKIWVDNLESPASALVWSDGLQCFHFMGCAYNRVFNNQLKTFIDDTIISFLKDKKLDFFEFSSDVEAWYSIIFDALSDRGIKENWQYVYKSKISSHQNGKTEIPNPYCLHQIDDSFISSIKNDKIVDNPEFLIDYIIQFWGSVENYLNLGYGYVVVGIKEIVSFSITSFLYDKTFSVGVETLEQHRRKGLASTLTNILLKSLYEKGCNIWWDCMDSNIASQKTSESAGLVLDHKYRVCWFNF